MKRDKMLQKTPTFKKELALYAQGFSFVAGIDEAGRGAWAGPVVAAAVIFPVNDTSLPVKLHTIRDSKMMTSRQRDAAFDVILSLALSVGLGVTAPGGIDRTNIVSATRRAMDIAVKKLMPQPHHLLIDAVSLTNTPIPQQSFYKAESISLSVAAASIIAKVTRDRLMELLAIRYPVYGFERHKGYGTKQHQQALSQYGPCHIHRFSYAPIRNLQDNTELSFGN